MDHQENTPQNDKKPWHLQPGIITLIVSVILLGICAVALLAFLGF